MGVVAISLWSDAMAKSFEKLCSEVFSPGTTFVTSGNSEISEGTEIHSRLARKNLKESGKTKVFEIHRSSKKAVPHSGESAAKRFMFL